ncbi:MAG: epoxide hydrolase [Microbacteriaceae bacterium]|nr:epoxide hydrolase [Microbacteriaceae bacterium]
MKAFTATTAPAELDDLRDRLRRTRFIEHPTAEGWAAGVPTDYLRRLVAYWLDGFEWAAQLERLNSYPQFTASVNGTELHFVHLRAEDPGAPAIILSHGWPYTFAEMLPLADELRGEFSVVIPSLPGFVYSQGSQPFVDQDIAPLFDSLMTETLGYQRYLTYGEDVGGGVSDALAAAFPGSVAGIIAPHPAFPPDERNLNLTDEEQRFFVFLASQWEGESAYSSEQSTKPDTLAAALNDSPAGLAAWIVEKFHAWSDGDFEGTFTLDQLLTTVMLYWTTGSIATSFRPYFDAHRGVALARITVPAAIMVQQHERGYPRSLAARTYDDIRSFDALEHGGHFTASEAPKAVADVIRRFARGLATG